MTNEQFDKLNTELQEVANAIAETIKAVQSILEELRVEKLGESIKQGEQAMYAKQAEPVQAEPVQAEPVQAIPIQAEPVQAEPVQAEPVQAIPIQAEPIQAAPTGGVMVTVEQINNLCRAKLATGITSETIVETIAQYGSNTISGIDRKFLPQLLNDIDLLVG